MNTWLFVILSALFLFVIYFSHPIGYLLTQLSISLFIVFQREGKKLISRHNLNALVSFLKNDSD